jgi:hypothetical protein
MTKYTGTESEKSNLQERSDFALTDAKVLEDMAHELRSLSFAIEACGHDGAIEYKKVCVLAPKLIKIIANYLPNGFEE